MTYSEMIKTGARIRGLMESNNLSVADLEAACGCSHQAVYYWLSGKAVPSVDNLLILAKLFHTTVDEILVSE